MIDPLKRYTWSLREGDEMHGLFDTIEAAVAAASAWIADEPHGTVVAYEVFDCRPAEPDDKHLCEWAEDVDIGSERWYEGQWIPENIVARGVAPGVTQAYL